MYYIDICIYIYIYTHYIYIYIYPCGRKVWRTAELTIPEREDTPEARSDAERITDGIGTPDPDPRN